MGTTEIIALVVVSVAAIAIVAIYMTASMNQFEKRRKQAENRRDEDVSDRPTQTHSQVDTSVDRVPESEGAPRRRRQDLEIEQDRVRDVAAERESHRF